jgi:hypothetical protein
MKINDMIQRPVFVTEDRSIAEKLRVHEGISYTFFRWYILIVFRLINILKELFHAQHSCIMHDRTLDNWDVHDGTV